MDFAKAVCADLMAQGHWADYIDPCSGLPMLHRDTGALRVQRAAAPLASERGGREHARPAQSSRSGSSPPTPPPAPCCGAGAVYGEVEALSTLRGFRTQNAGCCKIVLHPRWGSNVYPASMFAKAPPEAVAAALQRAEAALAERLAS